MSSIIIGLDEVGRGCLFGPVASAAVLIDSHVALPDGLTDSKKLTSAKRKKISTELLSSTHKISIGVCSPQEIDELNILQASLLSMKKAFEGLGFSEESYSNIELRIDGNQKIPNLDPRITQTTIIKGDLKDNSIAAASIIAKVYRDELVIEMDKEFPGYGLAGHKGYPTKTHKEALQKLGVTSQHRKTFRGVSEAL